MIPLATLNEHPWEVHLTPRPSAPVYSTDRATMNSAQSIRGKQDQYFYPPTPSELSQGVKVAQSCLTLCDPMDHTVHGILQARIPDWVIFPFSRESSQPRDWTQVCHIAGRFFTSWATREAQEYWSSSLSFLQQTFPTQELNQGLLYCRRILYQLSYQGSPDKNSIKFLIGDWAYRNKSVIISQNEKWLLAWSINKIKHLWHMKHHETSCQEMKSSIFHDHGYFKI